MKTCVNIEIIYFIIFISNIIRTCGKVSVLFLPTYDISVSHASISPEEPPVRVYLNIFPITVVEIIPDRMEIELELYVNVNWTDKRLNVEVDDKLASQKIFVLPMSDAVRMWKPPLYFINCRRCQKRENLNAPSRKNYEISVNADTKQFLMFYRDSLKFRCMFDFQDYPMDEHYCKINVALRINDNRDFGKIKVFHRIMLRDKVIDQLKTKIPPEYEFLYFYATSDCLYPEYERELFRVHVDHRPMMIDKLVDNLNYRIPSEYYYMKFDSGIACLQSENVKKYECLEYIIQFRRILFHYLMTLYIPSCMTVILSWLTLWLDVEEGAARVTIGVMNMLILSTEYASYIKILPEVTYVKAIDIWMLVCLISVFSLLVEFFVASYLNKRRVPHLKLVKGPIQVPKLRRITAVTTDTSEYRSFLPNQQYPVNRLDKIFRYAFPLVFGMFNIAYWTYYGLRTSVWS